MFITTINGNECKVYFKHGREDRTFRQRNGKMETYSHPVDTTCYVIDKKTNTAIATGYTKCHPKENFEYSEGRKRAIERALNSLSHLGVDRAQRSAIWMDYHSRAI